MRQIVITPEIDHIMEQGNFNLAEQPNGGLSWITFTAQLCCKEALYGNCTCMETVKDLASDIMHIFEVTSNEINIILDIDIKTRKPRGNKKVYSIESKFLNTTSDFKAYLYKIAAENLVFIDC